MPSGAFFISGLPGGLSYLLLGLYKIDVISAMTEKRITANLNTCATSLKLDVRTLDATC